MQALLLAGLGGALGSMGRYLCHRMLMHWMPMAFPWGTFVVNIIGCFLIGLFATWYGRGVIQSESLRIFLMVGICGGFTTFSAFTIEGIGLIKDNKIGIFLLYMCASVLLGLGATLLGMVVGRET